MAYTFIISDESVNSHGYRILTNGINTERFEKNPVMLYMHDEQRGVIGRWENIRKKGPQLLADAVFDETSELGKEVKNKVENRFLKATSLGIIISDFLKSDDAEPDTVSSCELCEVSIVAVPSNKNAVKLYDSKGRTLLSLNDLSASDLHKRLIELFGLAEDATDEDIINAVKSKQDTPEQDVQKALSLGFIDRESLALMTTLRKADEPAFRKFMADKQKNLSGEIHKVVSDAVRKGKIISFEKGVFENIGRSMGINTLKAVLSAMPEKVSLSAMLNNDKVKDRSKWTLMDYRKYAPHELRDNPQLYAELSQRDEENITLAEFDLEYYRRNNPEYLTENPDEYKRLLEKSKKKK